MNWVRWILCAAMIAVLISAARSCIHEPRPVAAPPAIRTPRGRPAEPRPSSANQSAPAAVTPNVAPVSSRRVTIVAVDFESGETLREAVAVLVGGLDGEPRPDPLGGEAGFVVELTGVAGEVEVRCPGYAPERIRPVPMRDRYEVRLHRTATLRIRVMDQEGNPVKTPCVVALQLAFTHTQWDPPAVAPFVAPTVVSVSAGPGGVVDVGGLRARREYRIVAVSEDLVAETLAETPAQGIEEVRLTARFLYVFTVRAVDPAGNPIVPVQGAFGPSISFSPPPNFDSTGASMVKDLDLLAVASSGRIRRRARSATCAEEVVQIVYATPEQAPELGPFRCAMFVPGWRRGIADVVATPPSRGDVYSDIVLEPLAGVRFGTLDIDYTPDERDHAALRSDGGGATRMISAFRLTVAPLHERGEGYYQVELPLRSFAELSGRRIERLPSGPYVVRLTAALDYRADSPGIEQRVDVVADTVTRVKLLPPLGGGVRVLPTINGKPVEGPIAVVVGPRDPQPGSWRVWTSFDGPPYILDRVAPSEYSVLVRHEALESAWVRVTVTEGGWAEANAPLNPRVPK